MKTVKVRIAVAVDAKGNWNSAGCDTFDDSEAMGYATEHVANGEARYFVTAELPVPDPAEIPGVVESVPDSEGDE